MTDDLTPVVKINLKTRVIDFAVRTMPEEIDDILMICIEEGFLDGKQAGIIRINYSLIMLGGRQLN